MLVPAPRGILHSGDPMTVKNIRDLLQGPAHPSEANSLRSIAREAVTERTVIPAENPSFTARMPGDSEDHPLTATSRNPFPGVGVQEVARRIRDGQIQDPTLERQARAYVDQFQKLEGQALYNSRNHEFEPTHSVFGAGIGGLRRADRFPEYESSSEHVESVIQQNRPAQAAPPQGGVSKEAFEALLNENETEALESLWRK